MTPLNPEYPYRKDRLDWEEESARIWLKVAKERGKMDHPMAKIARENIAFIERNRNERAG